MFLIYWISIFIMCFGAISYFRVDKEFEIKTLEDEDKNNALKKLLLLLIFIGFAVAISARIILNWNLENL